MGSLKSYITGFVLSIALTLLSYVLVTQRILTGSKLLIAISTLATYQAITQLFLFLHLGQEQKPRWNLIVFVYMVIVLATILFGSLWVMNHLDYRMMGI
jgi:cytochrome o ubiquinol oxidase operon protein cyoD